MYNYHEMSYVTSVSIPLDRGPQEAPWDRSWLRSARGLMFCNQWCNSLASLRSILISDDRSSITKDASFYPDARMHFFETPNWLIGPTSHNFKHKLNFFCVLLILMRLVRIASIRRKKNPLMLHIYEYRLHA